MKRRLALSHHLLWMRVQDSLAQLAGAATEPELAGVRGALEAQEENPLGLSQGGADRLAGVIDRLASVSFNEDLSVRPWWHPAPDIVYLGTHSFFSAQVSPHSFDFSLLSAFIGVCCCCWWW